MFTKFCFAFSCLILLTATACAPVQQTELAVFERPESEFVGVILVDLSGSFIEKMAVDGLAYKFSLSVVDRFMRERPGQEGRLIISQISATGDPLLWEGPPMQLRRDFASAESFRDFLIARSDPNGSRVYEGLANSLEYVSSHSAIRANNARPAVFVLSDMIDNAPDAEEQIQRVEKALADFARLNGVMGVYFVHQQLLADWNSRLSVSGMRNYRIECDIVTSPELPSFN